MFPFCRPNYHRRRVGRYDPIQARAHFLSVQGPFTTPQLAAAYGLPIIKPRMTAAPKIGIVSLGGGWTGGDVQAMAARDGTPVPNITNLSVRGATNRPGDDADVENLLDIYMQSLQSVITGLLSNIVFCSAPNDGKGIADGISACASAGCPNISLSWGASYPQWAASDVSYTEGSIRACSRAGINVWVASGDANANDGTGRPATDYPACGEYSIAVGGTMLTMSPFQEVVWNDAAAEGTGGGFNAAFPRPSYQPAPYGVATATGRGEPDVALNADPQTGYPLIVNGQTNVIGGTSAAAPGWAAFATAALACGMPQQFLAPVLYANALLFRDIVQGNNRPYPAGPGYDLCTGLGSMTASLFMQLIGSSAPPPTPLPPVPPAGPAPGIHLHFNRAVKAGGPVDFKSPIAIPAGSDWIMTEQNAPSPHAVPVS